MSKVPTTPLLLRRPWIKYALGLALVVGGVFWVKVGRPLQLTLQHSMVRTRMEQHLKKVIGQVESGPLRNEPDRAAVCEQFLVSIHNRVANRLMYRQNVYPEKFAALADRLEAGQGPDLRTIEGCVQLLRLLDEVSPSLHGDDILAEWGSVLDEPKAPPAQERITDRKLDH